MARGRTGLTPGQLIRWVRRALGMTLEAGYRCAIPTCRAIGPLQIEHINDWVKTQKHEFENMIVLCANCHGRKGDGRGQIDRKSLRHYKANLAVLLSRYSDLERRVLEVFAIQRQSLPDQNPRGGVVLVQVPGTLRLMMTYLIKDGYVEIAPAGTTYFGTVDGENIFRFLSRPGPGSLRELLPGVGVLPADRRGGRVLGRLVGCTADCPLMALDGLHGNEM